MKNHQKLAESVRICFYAEIISYALLFYNENGDFGQTSDRHTKNLQILGKQPFFGELLI